MARSQLSRGAQSSVLDVEEIASGCVGWTYQHHGRQPGLVDCFGLFLYIANKMGFDVPDYDYSEDWRGEDHFGLNYWKYADPIAEKDVQPGDVILLRMSGAHISHIGIVLRNGRFIHCTKAGATISRYTSAAFNRRIEMFCRLKNTT